MSPILHLGSPWTLTGVRALPSRCSAQLADDLLPPDWEATIDPSSGSTYYYNTKTNAVSWERPRAAL